MSGILFFIFASCHPLSLLIEFAEKMASKKGNIHGSKFHLICIQDLVLLNMTSLKCEVMQRYVHSLKTGKVTVNGKWYLSMVKIIGKPKSLLHMLIPFV